ncbi:16S rRNA (uracil(1498)-N(3))-methyltransferase [Candidatus Uhrbacteria bacterium]|nr:16S rRNA (uracil(1498)-N(3))-methyltransferase [Candidatus Uhrbacteria bacterium]
MRLARGDEIILCDTGGYDARVRITALAKKEMQGDVLSREKNTAEPKRYIALYCSVLKKENFELVVQKAVEAGVYEIVPLKTKRTVKTGISEDRLKKIAKEAAEQSGRARIPDIRARISFSEAISIILSEVMSSRVPSRDPDDIYDTRRDSSARGLGMTKNILFDGTGEDAIHFFQKIRKDARINIFIGPEGGWDAEELKETQENGFTVLSLGPRTLRAETAAAIGTFLAVSL